MHTLLTFRTCFHRYASRYFLWKAVAAKETNNKRTASYQGIKNKKIQRQAQEIINVLCKTTLL